MKDIVIIYHSKYGSTERYARWIAEATGGDVFNLKDFKASQLEPYQTVIFGSFTHMGKIKSIDFLKKHWPVLQKKNLIVFATAGTPSVGAKEEEIIEKNLPREAKGKVACFPLPGAYFYQKLDWKDRLFMEGPRLLLLFRFYIKKDPQAFQRLRHFAAPQDWTTREALRPLLAFLAAQTRI